MIGIAKVASPEVEGITNDRGRKSRNMMIKNAIAPVPPNAFSIQCRMVSVILPLFMITVIPRAIPMISATPRRSRAPSTKLVVRSPAGVARGGGERRACDEARGQFAFGEPPDQADDDRE